MTFFFNVFRIVYYLNLVIVNAIIHLLPFFIPDTMKKQITVTKLSAHVRHHEFTKNNGFVSEIETYSYYCETLTFVL